MITWGVFWTVEGMLRMAGITKINPKFEGKSWTKQYLRSMGLSWIIMGVLFVVFGVLDIFNIYNSNFVTELLLRLPGLLWSIAVESKYKKLADEELQ